MENINLYTLRVFVETAITLIVALIVLGIKIPSRGYRWTKTAKYLLFIAFMLLAAPMFTYQFYKVTKAIVFLSYLSDNLCYAFMLMAPTMILSEKYNMKIKPVIISLTGLFISLQCFFFLSYPFFGINSNIGKWISFSVSSLLILYLVYEGIRRLRECGFDRSVRWLWTFYFSVIAIIICYMLLLPIVRAMDIYTLYIKIIFTLASVLLIVQLFEYTSQLRRESETTVEQDRCDIEPVPSNIGTAHTISEEAETSLRDNLTKWIEEKRFLEPDEGMEVVARQLGTDIKTLRTYFRTKMPSDFRTWRISLRIEYAKKKLHEDPEISVNKLSDISGFTTRSNFYLYFKKDTGMTPAEYKESIAAKNNCATNQ